MRASISALILVASSSCVAQTAEENVRSPSDAAVVALLVDGTAYCAGALVERRLVLTSAHCLDELVLPDPTALVVRISLTGIDIPAAAVMRHPDWDPQRGRHDIGAVVLAQEAPVEPLALRPLSAEMLQHRHARLLSFDDQGRQASMPVLVEEHDTSVLFGVPADAEQCAGPHGVWVAKVRGADAVIGLSLGACGIALTATRVDHYVDGFVLPIEPESVVINVPQRAPVRPYRVLPARGAPLPLGSGARIQRRDAWADVDVMVPGSGNALLGVMEPIGDDARGGAVFTGILATERGTADKRGAGVFALAPDGAVRALVTPGDAAPGGGVFDLASLPSMNGRGDVAFAGHERASPCIDFGIPQRIRLGCAASVYLRRFDGAVERIARPGDLAPDGTVIRYATSPIINEEGDVLFVVDVSFQTLRRSLGILLYQSGALVPIAMPGDDLGDGAAIQSAALRPGVNPFTDDGWVQFRATVRTRSATRSLDCSWRTGELRC